MATQIKRFHKRLTLPILIEIFLADKQVEGRSPRTLDWYRERLERFCAFVTNGESPCLDELTLHDARSFVAHLQTTTYAASKRPEGAYRKGCITGRYKR